MGIRFPCQNSRCDHWLEVNEDRARSSTLCPACKMVQQVPGQESPATPTGIQEPTRQERPHPITLPAAIPERHRPLIQWDPSWLECPNCGRTATAEDERCPGCLRSLAREEVVRGFAQETNLQSAYFTLSLLAYAGLALMFLSGFCLVSSARTGTLDPGALAVVWLARFAGWVLFLVGFGFLVAYRGLSPLHFLWGLFCGVFGLLIVHLVSPNVRNERVLRYEKFLRDSPR